ncbi:MAG: hypothetical protein ACRD4F_15740, partial [Candidatus Angelobacter sp.]
FYVMDRCEAIRAVLAKGRIGETYNIGGCKENTNLEVVNAICALLDELRPSQSGVSWYAIDNCKIQSELGWKPRETFASAVRKIVLWYSRTRTGWKKSPAAPTGTGLPLITSFAR